MFRLRRDRSKYKYFLRDHRKVDDTTTEPLLVMSPEVHNEGASKCGQVSYGLLSSLGRNIYFKKVEMKTKVLEEESRTECVNWIGLIRVSARIETKLGEFVWERVLSWDWIIVESSKLMLILTSASNNESTNNNSSNFYCRRIFWLVTCCSLEMFTGELVLAEMHSKDSSRSTRSYRFVQISSYKGGLSLSSCYQCAFWFNQGTDRYFFEGGGRFGNFQIYSCAVKTAGKKKRSCQESHGVRIEQCFPLPRSCVWLLKIILTQAFAHQK